jgi:hypothetical protein
MPMKRFTVALVAGFSLAHSASADEAARRQATLDNLQADLSVCIAYYLLVRDCSGGEATNLKLAIDNLNRESAKAERALDMQTADAVMRLELNLASQRGLIEGSCSRIGTLQSRYADQCNALETSSK